MTTTREGSAVARHRTNVGQFIKFAMVGGSGTIVNMLVVILCRKTMWWIGHATEHDVLVNLFGTRFNVRWYHLIVIVAFLVANTWNFQLNRIWTFKSTHKGSWLKEFFPFLFTGIGALLVTFIVTTLLMNPTSPIALSPEFFDDSSGLKTRFYWASLIAIIVAMPVNFIVNKLWTFRHHDDRDIVITRRVR